MRTHLFSISLGLFVLIIACARSGPAQNSDEVKVLREEIQKLREDQKALRKDLEEIKSIVTGRREAQPPQDLTLSVEGAPFMGDEKAKLTLIEFSDYQCPFCARHASQTLPQIVTDYVKTGKVKYVLRDFPLEPIHPSALKAAEAARCAGDQGKYWPMHDRLVVNPRNLGAEDMTGHAKAVGLDLQPFQGCLGSGKHAAKVRQDLADGQNAGVNGTPTFFIGFTDQKSPKIRATKMLVGAQPFPKFKEAIEGLLSSKQ